MACLTRAFQITLKWKHVAWLVLYIYKRLCWSGSGYSMFPYKEQKMIFIENFWGLGVKIIYLINANIMEAVII